MYGKILEHSCAPVFMEINLGSFTYDELVRVSNDFKEELGRGSFGEGCSKRFF